MTIKFRNKYQSASNNVVYGSFNLFRSLLFLFLFLSFFAGQALAQTKTEKKQTSEKKAPPERKSVTEKKDLFENAEFFFYNYIAGQ